MTKIIDEKICFEPLSKENVSSVHRMCKESVRGISQTLKTFKFATIEDNRFDPNFTIVALNKSNEVIAFFMVVFRNSLFMKKRRKVAVLKFFVVHKEWRLKGLGSKIFSILSDKIMGSEQKCFFMKFEVMTSMPNYWYPGLNPEHTEAYFFLKKHGFKKGNERVNLCLDLGDLGENSPIRSVGNFEISRAIPEDRKELLRLKFMPRRYRWLFWSDEINLSFKKDPITTFVAKDKRTNEIIGWASHSIQFPGSFGPTGVSKKARGQGLGTILLYWCLWDIKSQYQLKNAKILWVVGNTIYFYLKSIGARICEFYWEMKKRI